jgi:hypothetical protein
MATRRVENEERHGPKLPVDTGLQMVSKIPIGKRTCGARLCFRIVLEKYEATQLVCGWKVL